MNPHPARPSRVRLREVILLLGVLFTPFAVADEDGDVAALTESSERGPVRVTVTLTPAEPVIGDPLKLTLTAVAEPGVELLMPEFEEGLDRFSISWFSPKEEVDAEGNTVATQRYTLQAPRSGEHSIPPLLVEFIDRRDGYDAAPEGEDAYELLTERLDFEVQSVLPADLEIEMHPPLGTLAPLPEPAARWPWYLGGGALVVLALASPLLLAAWRRWRRLARRKSAYELARVRLERLLAQPRPGPDTVEPFFVELSAIVRQYLEDRFELRAPELTSEEFLELASQSPDVSAEHQSLLRSFLREADLVKFAHTVPPAEAIDECIGSARRFLEETRENAPLLDPGDPDAEPAPGEKEAAGV